MREQDEQMLKCVRHRCGYPLRVQVLTQFEGTHGEMVVVVAYRSASEEESALSLYGCPQCGKLLRLWWPVEGRDDYGGCAC